MGNEQEDCGICLEACDDLRMLPCFHVGCMTCILGMTQTGQGRAVTCHICREPCLFENIRSLPRPVRCEMCKNFVKNPKKFPCCHRLLCSVCTSRTALYGSSVLCPNKCRNEFCNVEDLPSARICRTCFRLNTDRVPGCGHAMCLACQVSQTTQQRGCPLCSAIENPLPIAVNPMQPAPGQTNSAFLGVMQQQSQQLDQMQLQAAYQIIARQLQRNAAQQQQQQQQQALDVPHSSEDLIKALAFFVILLVCSFFTGLTYWLWIVGGVTLLFLRQNAIVLQLEFNILIILLWLISFYQYFWVTLGTTIFDKGTPFIINFVCNKFQVLSDFNLLLTLVAFGGEIYILYQYLAPIFWHRLALSFVIWVVNEHVKNKQQQRRLL